MRIISVLALKFGSKILLTKIKTLYLYTKNFIDSLRFMQSSLDKLVQSLPEDGFDILDNHFEYCDQNDVKLLHGKGFYPYSYMDTFRKFTLKNYHLKSAGSTSSNQEKSQLGKMTTKKIS